MYVRGDSRRDLYAKLLALCGLGLLAGAGALVDYWPMPGELPRVAASRPVPELPPLPGVDPDAVTLVAAAALTPSRRPGSPVRRVRAAAPPPLLPVATSIAPALLDSDLWILDPPPPAPVAALVIPPLPISVTARLPLPDGLLSLPGVLPAPIAALEPGNHDAADNFLSGAVRKTGAVASASLVKTGDAIVKGGTIAGASIVDMFRGLAGAVKRVTPFVP